jgi:type VI secretion system protein ImpK
MDKPDYFSKFGDDDKTFVRPSPGGRRRPARQVPSTQLSMSAKSTMDGQGTPSPGSNPICANAFFLLSLVPKLRILAFHHDINELQEQLVREIQNFENRAINLGSAREHLKIACYFLCALIDETVLNTPWGSQSNWGHHSLLIRFHDEAWGGERFFQILERLKQHPAQNQHLLELAYLCLSLGFEGKYRVAGSGIRELEQLRQDLYLLLQRLKADPERALSVNWQGLRGLRHSLIQQVPVWVVAVVTGVVLMAIYMGYSYAINGASDQVYKEVSALMKAEKQAVPVRLREPSAPARAPARSDRFKRLLAAEIAQGMVEVLDGNLLRISNSFVSGSDQIKPDFLPLLAKIAQELQTDTSRIAVVGHTDDRPIFSTRFPSNWHLSQARAKNAAIILETAASLPKRVSFEGHADSEPIGPNDSAENRARNRRIDIHIR